MKRAGFQGFWHTLITLLGGASLGLLLAWLVSRDRSGGAPVVRAPSAEGEPAGSGRWSTAVDSFRGERIRAPRAPDLDLDGLRVAVAHVPGTEQIHLRHLGGGIVEALGAAPDPGTVHQVLTVLRTGAGVTVVVNRIWTPVSAHGKKPDLSHIPRARRDTSVN
jgi:hypothetical protein